MQKLLIVEDDLGISNSLKLYLESSQFEVHLHNEGGEAIQKISEIKPDLLILDINLPGKNGIEIAKELRETSNLPIIILTARGGEVDKITGLEIGVDDYMAKPFSPRELLARINTILRRANFDENQEKGNTIEFGSVSIDLDRKIVKLNNIEIAFTGNEFDILKKIVEENGKIVKRETLMKEVIGYDQYLFDRTIDTHIKNLRKKLGNKDIILTVRGEGYRLNK